MDISDWQKEWDVMGTSKTSNGGTIKHYRNIPLSTHRRVLELGWKETDDTWYTGRYEKDGEVWHWAGILDVQPLFGSRSWK